jgi:ribonuclease R
MSRKHEKKKKKRSYPDNNNTLKGVLDITRSGIGYVIVENLPNDILVRPNDFNTALHGDTVKVRVTGGGKQSGRMQGEVTEVVQRKQIEFLGKIEINKNTAFFIPDANKPMPDMYVPNENLNGAEDNNRVIVRITEWEKNRKPVATVIQVMKEGDENDMAMKEILMENGFPLFFPENVVEEAERTPDTISPQEIERRKDMRDVLTFTIDPVDAKDFDDAISFRVLKNGNYEIGVHIADVSYYVEPDSALDKEAYDRATSVYLPDRVSPMLPERISNELCSLRPKEDKLTFSAIFQMTPKGDVKQSWLGKTLMHSNHGFSFVDVLDII